MEIRRFGPGHRRPDGPPGTRGLAGQVIWNDDRAHISEFAFSPHGLITPHTNPNTTLFIVVSGGGFVQVGDERIRINHGEAVVWPPDVPHGAYTDGVEMRAIVVELPVAPAGGIVVDGATARLEPGGSAPPGGGGPGRSGAPEAGTAAVSASDRAEPARGQLAEPDARRSTYDASEGEPW